MHFPSICIDNFYQNPEKILKIANDLEYQHNKDGYYPGARTAPLHEASPELFDIFCKKLFSVFYDFNKMNVNWIVSTYFQKIDGYEDSRLNDGWIHQDDDHIFAGVVYLNKTPNPEAGTSLFSLKQDGVYDNEQHIKHEFYKNSNIDKEFYIKSKEQNNSNFIEICRFNNVYNRLIAYEGTQYHKANQFSSMNSEPRLTQVFFVTRVDAENTPITRLKDIVETIDA